MTCILIVDDEQMVRETLRDILEREGHEVIEARDGSEGLRRFSEHRTDLVILDTLMPNKDGIETLIEFKRQHPELKVLAISGGGYAGDLDYLDIAKKLGADGGLAKPFTRKALLGAIATALA